MNHLNKKKKIGKDSKHKHAILRNLSRALISRERVLTTLPKGRLLRSFVEKLITRAKTNTLHNRRLAYKELYDAKLLLKLFDDIAKRYLERPGGYTRMIKVGMRKGDGSEMCYIELVPQLLKESQPDQETSSTSKTKRSSNNHSEDNETTKTTKETDTKRSPSKETEAAKHSAPVLS